MHEHYASVPCTPPPHMKKKEELILEGQSRNGGQIKKAVERVNLGKGIQTAGQWNHISPKGKYRGK